MLCTVCDINKNYELQKKKLFKGTGFVVDSTVHKG